MWMIYSNPDHHRFKDMKPERKEKKYLEILDTGINLQK
jgi:hypothetical protein